MNKPIAVISDSYLHAENYMRNHYNLEKFDRKAGYYEANSQSYIVIVQPEQAMGYEFSDYLIATNEIHSENMQYLIAFVKSRVR